MNTQKVAVVTGASQGIGAAVVEAYRKLGYAVVANSRSITPSGDAGILAVAGDIADPAVGARVIDQALATSSSRSRSPTTPATTSTW
jgi:NAD(P)-dependent dehydrogenase (short-subunit alcohol dehydrogenase family)